MNEACSSHDSLPLLEVFFDGECPVCRREIEMVRGWNLPNPMVFTDLSRPEFDAIGETGKTLETLMREIHARIGMTGESSDQDHAKWIVGVDVFREIYTRAGFKKSVWISKLPVFKQTIRVGYRVFAFVSVSISHEAFVGKKRMY